MSHRLSHRVSHRVSHRLSPLRRPVTAAVLAAAMATGIAAVPLVATSAAAAPIQYANGAVEVPIAPQAQQQTNWCWAATGNTIATYKSKSVSQNVFCNLAFGRSTGSSCPNSQATLANDQTAFRALGITPGRYISGTLGLSGVESEIRGDRPILTRIQWSSGGGHMMVISGVRSSDKTIQWYDPWPSSQRVNVGTHAYYVNNYDFAWTHSLYGIGA